jgi:hypothetical protein
MPIILYSQMRECDIDVPGPVTLQGPKSKGSGQSFYISGHNTLICEELNVAAAAISLDGRIWMEANDSTSQGPYSLLPKEGTQVGWGGELGALFPWNRLSSTIQAPYAAPDDILGDLLTELRWRLPAGQPIWLNSDLSVQSSERRWRWAARRFPAQVPILINLMREHRLASTEVDEVGGRDRRVRVRFEVTWEQLLEAVRNPTVTPAPLREFVAEARQLING